MKKKNNPESATDNVNYDGPNDVDLDNEELPPANSLPGGDDGDDEFEFDMSLLPKGVKLVDLAPDFIRPEGFLMVPRLNKKTGEIFPMTATFFGLLNDVVPWKDNRGKERFWYSCTSMANFPDMQYTGRDEQNKAFVKPVQKGDRIGISSSGAIYALKNKKGHYVYLHWTGNKIDTKNGPMWEIKAKVSKKPAETDESPF
jgi:hypothetical protein